MGAPEYGALMDQDRAAFGAAVARHLASTGHSQQSLASALSAATGRTKPFDQSTVTRWVRGENAPDPATVFALEELLELAPGSLSRFLGYLPADIVETPPTVPAAVQADVGLTAMGRRVLLKVYEEVLDDGPHSP